MQSLIPLIRPSSWSCTAVVETGSRLWSSASSLPCEAAHHLFRPGRWTSALCQRLHWLQCVEIGSSLTWMPTFQISTKVSASILCGSNNLPDVRQTSDCKQVAVFRRLAVIPMTVDATLLCVTRVPADKVDSVDFLLYCVCEIQVLSVDACDATNGLDVGSRYNFYSELFELGWLLESQKVTRMAWTRNLLVRSGTSVSSHALHGFCQMWFVLITAAYWMS